MNSLEAVLEGGFCIGCGACAARSDSPFRVEFGGGRYLVRRVGSENLRTHIATVCPFFNAELNEDDIAQNVFAISGLKHDHRVGFYRKTGVAHVDDSSIRVESSFGGIATWLLNRLLDTGVIDGVIHMRPRQPSAVDPRLFAYTISRTRNDLNLGGSSHYYPVSMTDVLQEAKVCRGRYALVGIPCFVKAARLLVREPLSGGIIFMIGLVCEHLKTAGFAELLAIQMGVTPPNIGAVHLRVKIPPKPVNLYGVRVESLTAENGSNVVARQNADLFGTDWGHRFFKHKSCDACNDIFSETADFVIGDAWLPEDRKDSLGTSVILTSNKEIDDVLASGVISGELRFRELPVEKIVASQRANFAHPRTDLPVRLRAYDDAGTWRPRKRFESLSDEANAERLEVVNWRKKMPEITEAAWRSGRDIRPARHALKQFAML